MLLINTAEMFDIYGSGIKYFSRTLYNAVAQAKIEIALLLETQASIGQSPLAASNIYQLHKKYHGQEIYVKAKNLLKAKLQTILPFGSQAQTVSLDRIPTSDQLYSLGIGMLPREGLGTPTEPPSTNNSTHLFHSKELFSKALLGFKANHNFTTLRLAREDSRLIKGDQLFFHNPMPFPLHVEGAKNVTTIHDLIPLTHPELCLDDPSHFFSLIAHSIKNSATIHAISQYTADQLMQVFGEEVRSKLTVLHQPTPVQPSSPEKETAILKRSLRAFDRLQNGEDSYLLQLGSIEPKKNHLTTLQAFKKIRQHYPNLNLVIIGKRGWLCDEICNQFTQEASNGVHWLGAQPRSAVQHYLDTSVALIFPSIVEGWGLPPLEAMSAGTPVVAAGIPACREACGDAALFVNDPLDVAGFSNKLQSLLGDRELYKQMVERGQARSQIHTITTFSYGLVDLYR